MLTFLLHLRDSQILQFVFVHTLLLCPHTSPLSTHFSFVHTLLLCPHTSPLSTHFSSVHTLLLCPHTSPLSTHFSFKCQSPFQKINNQESFAHTSFSASKRFWRFLSSSLPTSLALVACYN